MGVSMDRLRQSDSEGRLNNMLHGLNALGSTAWRVNEDVLNVAMYLQDSVGWVDQEGPIPCSDGAGDSFDAYAQEVATEDFDNVGNCHAYTAAATYADEQLNAIRTNRKAAKFTIEIARQFAGLTFYLPHSVDFRGRAYPIPPFLNHLGNDFTRGWCVEKFERERGGGREFVMYCNACAAII